jgi:SAM-dependent methyltransferase
MSGEDLGRAERLTYKGNLRTTRHGWIRLTPAYSVHLVGELLDQLPLGSGAVLDPFCGTGTTALVCAERGIRARTTDINPFLVWLARAKTRRYTPGDIGQFEKLGAAAARAISAGASSDVWVPALYRIDRWWDPCTLQALGRLMARIRCDEPKTTDRVADLLKVAFCRTMIESAEVSFGHQSMSFRKTPRTHCRRKDIARDAVAELWRAAMELVARSASSPIARVPRTLLCDARDLGSRLEPGHFGCVITSPPYPNRMSYIRELRPYMYWLGYLCDGRGAGELDWRAIGGTWGCATSNVAKWEPPEPVRIPHPGFPRLLARISERSPVLARYVHKYFHDMVLHCRSLFEVVRPGATVHYIVGNSRFYDTVLPVEQIFARLFESSGFAGCATRAIRKRSSKKELYEFVVSSHKPA